MLKDLKIFSQNVRKNNIIINTILGVNHDFDIIFIQESLWTTIRSIPSSKNCEGIPLIGVTNHPNWLTFTRGSDMENNYPRVIIYVNIRLSSFWFSLCKDIFNHRDILLVSFFNNNDIFWIMNVYSDSSHSALKHLKDTEANICNLLIITGDFNIRDNHWDPLFPHYLSISDDLIIIADLFNLDLSMPTNQVATRYSDNPNDTNSVIDLMFLWSGSLELNNHTIHPEWCLMSDHAPLNISIPIVEEFVNSSKWSIIKNSKEEAAFIKDITNFFKELNTSNLLDSNWLENAVNSFANSVEHAWERNFKSINVTKHSKSWWNEDCNKSLTKYKSSRNLEDWKYFWNTVKITKYTFFNNKIQEIANKRWGPWELIKWVNKQKLLAIKAIKYNSQSCLNIDDLWWALHLLFNTALYSSVDINILDKINSISPLPWNPFSKEEFKIAISSCNNSFSLGPDKLSWSHPKLILQNNECLIDIIRIANLCIDLGY